MKFIYRNVGKVKAVLMMLASLVFVYLVIEVLDYVYGCAKDAPELLKYIMFLIAILPLVYSAKKIELEFVTKAKNKTSGKRSFS
ncbi:hypothetical protein KO507_16510 [Gilvimarinus agarilyticus]|uniref:hypothetical protein n=1 Tax=Gilvimarinus sp. 2_MG-2023 TaxID=3062666 RepID=UPI001C089C4F|nr:hypothetical protein [Gilvimarinus sp. 2_MG-2023]MBU2887369.1 hypothetical protein [Gilvimarinus agarilyticus]MDO6572028.1 hypothetical protein [Gilvimarinus sp. 2_MG-2023]